MVGPLREVKARNAVTRFRMQKFACNNWAAPMQNGSYATVPAAVAAFTSDNNQLNRLVHIARARLDRLAALPPGQRLRSREDPLGFVHDTIALVLAGKRKAHPRHLSDSYAFFNFLQGVLQSCISNALKSIVAEGEHVPIGPTDDPSVPFADPESPANVVNEVSLRETKSELVARLRQSFADDPAMQQHVDLLEKSGLNEDRLLPGEISDKQRHRLRTRAQQVLREMSAHEGVSQPTGMELLEP